MNAPIQNNTAFGKIDDITLADITDRQRMRAASDRFLRRIKRELAGLPNDDDQPSISPRVTRPWTSCEVATLRRMHGEGFSTREMADALERGEGSIKDGIRRHIKGFDRYGNLKAPAHGAVWPALA